jgi:hypothetical protein
MNDVPSSEPAMNVFEDIDFVQAFLNGQIAFLTTFLTDVKAFLLVRAVLNAMEASGEGDEGKESIDGEHEGNVA